MTTPTRPQLNAEKSLGGYTQRHARKLYIGELGNNSGVVDDTARTTSGQDFVFVRLNQDANQVVSALAATSFPHVADIIVILELVERKGAPYYQVLGIAPNIVYSTATATWSGVPGEHANQHERRDRGAGGFDPLDVYTRALVNLRARAQTTPDLTLHVERGFYIFSSVKEYTGGNSPAFVPPVVVSSQRWDLLYLGSDDALHIISGVAVVGFGTPAYPACPIDAIPLAYVLLRTAQTSILEADITDARVLWTAVASASAHNVLSATHTDTTVAVPGDDNVLTWDTASGKWRAEPIPGATTNLITAGAISTITDDAKYNAWPCVCRMTNGNLLAVYVKGNGHNSDVSGVIKGRISSDSGATWAAEFTIASDGTYGCINPSVICLASGRVLVAYTLFNGTIDIPDGVRVKSSDDNGGTWSAPVTVNSSYATQVSVGGDFAQLANGTVLLPIYGIDPAETFFSAALMQSADLGDTWGSEVLIADGEAASVQYFEPSLLLLNDGHLLCLIRTSTGAGNIVQSESTNSGATWSVPAVAFAGYSTPHTIQTSAGTCVSIVRGNAAGKLEVFASTNRGGDWISQGIFDNTTYTELEYGAAVELADRTLLIIYSVQPTAATTNADIKQVYATDFTVDTNTDTVDGMHASEFAGSAHTHTHASTTGKTANDHHNQAHILGTGGDHSDAPANQANGFVKRNAANGAWEEVPYGSASNTVAQGDHTHASGGGGHLHGLDRWLADGAASAFDLLDIAEYVDSVTDNGLDVDALTYSLSADGAQVVFASVPTVAHVLQCNYVIMGA